MNTLYLPELLYLDGVFQSDAGLLVDEAGVVVDAGVGIKSGDANVVRMPGKAILPGLVNVHSHSFQRLIRGMAESRASSGVDFWSWRGRMYQAATALSPEDLYDVSRMVFLEMAFSGITTVGEFHYLHNQPDGTPYDDPNLLGKTVWEAAQSVGIHLVLLRTAYLRSGHRLERDPGQIRFFETASQFLVNIAALKRDRPEIPLGVAPHSIRAVPIDDVVPIVDWARTESLPIHMHVSEQVAENEACLSEWGITPFSLLHQHGILGPDFVAVHATHLSDFEVVYLTESHSQVCACPTTERNLGDGILSADKLVSHGIPISFGTDSQAQIDLFEDARELDYHLRLRDRKRAILDRLNGQPMARMLFECATAHGAKALNRNGGDFKPGSDADFTAFDLRDPSIAGTGPEHLLSAIVFGIDRSAVTDVFVNGRAVIQNRLHPQQEEIVSRYVDLSGRVWRASTS